MKGNKNSPTHWVDYAITDKNWKLLSTDGSKVELYDIVGDPLERNEIAQTNPETTTKLLGKIEQWRQTLPAAPLEKNFSKLRNE